METRSGGTNHVVGGAGDGDTFAGVDGEVGVGGGEAGWAEQAARDCRALFAHLPLAVRQAPWLLRP